MRGMAEGGMEGREGDHERDGRGRDGGEGGGS